MPWYRQGSVAITAGQTAVTGTGTNFALNARAGDAFLGPDGRWYEVANVASDSVLGILPVYQGANVASGVYGIAPMQGYVKDAADRLKQIAEQFGATLSLLGQPQDAAGLRLNIGAAAQGANSDITSMAGLTTALSVAQGGTGGKTPAEARQGLGASATGDALFTAATPAAARSALVLGSAATAAVFGAVASGAIFESGANSNGRYTKFADGTMICEGSAALGSATINRPFGALFVSNLIAGASYPASFVGVPECIIQIVPSGGTAFCVPNGPGSSGVSPGFFAIAPTSEAQTVTVRYIAKGRWAA